MNSYIQGFFQRNSRTILTFIGVTGVISTGILCAYNTTKAQKVIENKQLMTQKEKIKAIIPIYIPTILVSGLTIISIFGLNAKASSTIASLTSSGAITYGAFNRYKEKVKDYISELSEEAKPLKENDISDTEKEEKMLFFDSFSGRYFKAYPINVRSSEYHLNRNFILKGDVSINEFYDFLGIPSNEDDEWFHFGWDNYTYETEYGSLWIDFNHEKKVTKDGKKYLEISYPVEPYYLYEDKP